MTNTVEHTIDHLFRHEYGRITSILTSKYGVWAINFIEDAVQEALLKAMQLWPYGEMPDNPTAWLYRVARNKLIDVLRREQRTQELNIVQESGEDPAFVNSGAEIEDDQLKMIFACCNSLLSERDSLLLSLKLVGGFSVLEIARALRLKEEAAKKSVQRARLKFKEQVKKVYFPEGKALLSYKQRVLRVIYLIFNEGYKASEGDMLIKEDLCGEALRLAILLSGNAYCQGPDVDSLISLMSFKASRFNARLDDNDELVLLEDQDRALWNNELIQWGFYYFNKATTGSEYGSYYLEAAIEFQYHRSGSYDTIEWKQILGIYMLLMNYKRDAFTRLNFLVVHSYVHGPKSALDELVLLEEKLGDHHLYHAFYAQLLDQLGDAKKAIDHLHKAISLADNLVEKKHLEKKREKLLRASLSS